MTTSTGSSRYNPPPSCDNPGRREKRSLWYRAHRYRRQLRHDEPLLELYPDTPIFVGNRLEQMSFCGTYNSYLFRFYKRHRDIKTAFRIIVDYNLGKGKYA